MTHSSNMEKQDEILSIINELEKKLPNIWVGYILTAIFFVAEYVIFIISPKKAQLFLFNSLFLIPIAFYFFWCIARFHCVLRIATFNKYPVGAVKAVGFHFIPLFNIYWVFRWLYQLADFVNKKQETKIMAKWVGVFLFLGVVLTHMFYGAVGIAVCFSVLFYVHRKLRKFFSMSYFSQSLKEHNKTDGLSIKAISTKIKPFARESGERNAMLIAAAIILFVCLISFERYFTISCKYFSQKNGIRITLKVNISNASKRNFVENYIQTVIYDRAKAMGVRCSRTSSNQEGIIIVSLPGIKDIRKAEKIIMPGYLEFKLVDETGDLEAALNGISPPGTVVLFRVDEDPDTQRITKTPFLLKSKALLTIGNLTDARVQIDSQFNEPYITVDFDEEGTQIIERITSENINRRLAIVLDNRVYSAPVIQEKISGGKVRITGKFTTEEARAMAAAFKFGPLPHAIEVVEITPYNDNN